MSAWIVFVVGCLFLLQGVCILNGWLGVLRVLRVFPNRSGWGCVAMGAGFATDGLPKIAGWSDSVTMAFATAGLALIILGAVIIWRDTVARRQRRSNGI